MQQHMSIPAFCQCAEALAKSHSMIQHGQGAKVRFPRPVLNDLALS